MKSKVILGAILTILLSSCGEKLDDLELQIINQHIAEDLYQQNSLEVAEALDDYIFEGLQEYADECEDQTEREIREHQSAVAMFGDWDIGSAVFGEPSKEDKLLRKYNSYIDYANQNRQKVYDLIMNMTKILTEKRNTPIPSIGLNDEVNLAYTFNNLEYIPPTISKTLYDKYISLSFNQSDAKEWAGAILPFSNKPSLQYGILAVAVIKMMREVTFPKAVYAVYNKDYDAWNVGYDTENAFLVKFIIDNDVENWEIEETNYVPAYITSKGNVLKQ